MAVGHTKWYGCRLGVAGVHFGGPQYHGTTESTMARDDEVNKHQVLMHGRRTMWESTYHRVAGTLSQWLAHAFAGGMESHHACAL